jgi:cytochrome c oxidase cbb3-type subunit III
MARPKDHLSDHEYDGIREYDNPTPGWWHAIFLASIVFSVLYIIYFEFNATAPTPHTRLARMQLEENRRIFGEIGDLEPDEQTMLMLMDNDVLMSVAAGSFRSACAQCHGANGAAIGLSGVNLTDDHFKNARTLADFYAVITNGAANGAMPSWQAAFSKNERVLLAAYSASLRGTNVPGGKAPEGEVIPPWPARTTADKAP